MLDATIGWSSDQGRAGEKLLTKVDEVVTSLQSQPVDFETLQTELSTFLGKDQSRIQKLERGHPRPQCFLTHRVGDRFNWSKHLSVAVFAHCLVDG